MDQISSMLTPFKSGWYSFGLEAYRPCNGTYCLYPYESLPPIPESSLQGTLHWLEPSDSDINRERQQYYSSPEAQTYTTARLREIKASARQLGLSIPDTFLQLMAAPELLGCIPSCTGCYFELSEIAPCPGSEEGYIIRFLNDSQGCLMWYLYVTPYGDLCILVSYAWLDMLTDPQYNEISEEEAIEGTYVCASTFETFLYRFWLENTIWYKHIWYKGQKSLTEEEERYLSHYLQRKDELS